MLIILDESIHISLNNNRDLTIACLENIAESIRTNKHIVLGKRRFLRQIYMLNDLGKTAKRTFSSLHNIVTEIGSIKKKVQSYILVRGDIKYIQQNVDEDGNEIYEVPIYYFDNSQKILPTRLVAEDENDYIFYTMIAKKYIRENGINCELSTHFVNGGGANTYKNYINEINMCGAPCLVVVDSDKKNEQDQYGNTAKNVLEKYDEVYKNHMTDYYILNVREKENLITSKLYSLCSRSGDVADTINTLLRIERNNILRNIYIYGDVKSGIKAGEILGDEHNKNTVSEYIRNEYEKMINQDEFDEKLLEQISKIVDEACNSNRMMSIFNDVNKNRNKEYDIKSIFEDITEKYDDSKKSIKLTEGIGWLMENFQNEILDNGNKKKLEEKSKLYEQHQNKKLKEQIDNLQKLCKDSENLFSQLPNYIKDQWIGVADKIITWGCCKRVSIAS